jgi:hypothetical protein
MAFLDAHMLTFPQLLCLCGVWPMSWQSAVLVAPIEEQPSYSILLVHKTGAVESKCRLLFLGRCNLQEGRVIGLDLTSESISGGLDNSSSLFSLQHLQTPEFGL